MRMAAGILNFIRSSMACRPTYFLRPAKEIPREIPLRILRRTEAMRTRMPPIMSRTSRALPGSCAGRREVAPQEERVSPTLERLGRQQSRKADSSGKAVFEMATMREVFVLQFNLVQLKGGEKTAMNN